VDDDDIDELQLSSTYFDEIRPTNNNKRHKHKIYSHQNGYGKIVANTSTSHSHHDTTISTHLTDIQHSSPMRLVPSRRTNPIYHNDNRTKQTQKYEAALIHLSSYGGGLVPGDSLHLDVTVRGYGAIVCILTQGGQRIYRPGQHFGQHDSYRHETVESKTNQEVNNISSPSSKLCKSTIQCKVEPGSTLIYLPDPTVPYYQSSFQEIREFICQYDKQSNTSMGSIIAVDCYSSGRKFSTGMEDERWAFDYLATRSELYIEEQRGDNIEEPNGYRRPSLIESMIFDNIQSEATSTSQRTPTAIAFGHNLESMATLLLHGPASQPVANRAITLSHHLAALCTRTRPSYDMDDDDSNKENDDNLQLLLKSLGGKVLLSVTPIKHKHNEKEHDEQNAPTHVVRILAESNEDIYRVLHYCLKPCSTHLGGLEPYRDRIHSSRTVANNGKSSITLQTKQVSNDQKQQEENNTQIQQQTRQRKSDLNSIANKLIFGDQHRDVTFDKEAWFRLCTLSDSALPVGSFAHSLGIEAASQMNLFIDEGKEATMKNHSSDQWSIRSDDSSSCSIEALSDYIHSVSRSNARFSTPLVMAGYSLLASPCADVNNAHQTWLDIDAYADTLLLSNEPGRRASTDQGLGILRIAPAFIESQNHMAQSREVSELWDMIRTSIDNNQHIDVGSSYNKWQSSVANGHAAPIYGVLASSLNISPLDACRVYVFSAARDTVSAAVRLNLVGPMEGLSILDGVARGAVENGLEDSLVGMRVGETQKQWLNSIATCAPLMDTVQPLHDLLSVRLFRT